MCDEKRIMENNEPHSLHNIIFVCPVKCRWVPPFSFLSSNFFFFFYFYSSCCLLCVSVCLYENYSLVARASAVECNSIFLTVTIIVVLIIAITRVWLKCGRTLWYVCDGVFLSVLFFFQHSFFFASGFFSIYSCALLLNSLSPKCVCINSPQNFTSL